MSVLVGIGFAPSSETTSTQQPTDAWEDLPQADLPRFELSAEKPEGFDFVEATVWTDDAEALSGFLESKGAALRLIAEPPESGSLPRVDRTAVRVRVPLSALQELQDLRGVVRVVVGEEKQPLSATVQEQVAPRQIPRDVLSGPDDPLPTSYSVPRVHDVDDVWAMGYNGSGVNVAVLDQGIDFAHPNLVGQWAVDDNPASPYYGWPIMLHAGSLDFVTGLWTAGSDWDRYPYPVFASYGESSWYSDTSYQAQVDPLGYVGYHHGQDGQYTKRYNPNGYGGPPDFNRIQRDYFVGIPGNPGSIESASGWFHLGIAKDDQLTAIYAERVGILVVDSTTPLKYDTVYVDLDNDLDFTDEIGCSKAQPLCYKDVNMDTFPDLSGGLLYYISDTMASITGETVIASAVGDETSAALADGYIVSDIFANDPYITSLLYQDGNYWPSATETIYQDLILSATGGETGTSVFLDDTSWNFNTGATVDATWVLQNYDVSFIYDIGNSTIALTEGVDFTLNYGSGEVTWLRDFPVGDHVYIFYQFDTWTIDFNTGDLAFIVPPIAGATVTADYDTGLPFPYSVQWSTDNGYDNFIPASGDLVAMYGAFNSDEYDGTSLASSITGKPVGNMNGMLDAYGTAPGAKLIGVEVYEFDSPVDLYNFAVEGYDGMPGTGDEANIAVNGWGYAQALNSGWMHEDRALYDLVTRSSNVTFIFPSGDTGPGYGTMVSPGAGPGVLTVGMGLDMNYRYLFGYDGGEAYYCWPLLGEGVSGCGPYGDVSPDSSRGPTMLGTPEPDVLATGSYLIAACPLNYAINQGWGTDGLNAWDLLGSAGLSAAVAGGIVALEYEAYEQSHGEWPTWQLAIDTLTSTADDHHLDILSQGAGWVNATRAVEAILEAEGVLPDVPRWVPGNYGGMERPGFINFLTAGATDSVTVTLANHGPIPETVTVYDAVFARSGEISFEWNFSSTYPDIEYRIVNTTGVYEADGTPVNVTDLSTLWNGADFMKVNVIRDPRSLTATPYVVMDLFDWYNVVNFSIFDGSSERNMLARALPGWGANVITATVHSPAERLHDGLIIGLRDVVGAFGPSPVVVEFYERVDWSWLTDDSGGSLSIAAGGTASFSAMMSVPADADPGSYQGAIYIEDSSGRTTTVPILVNVPFEGFPAYFGGNTPATSLYDNNALTQGQISSDRQIGDNRYFWVLLPTMTVESRTKFINDFYWTDEMSEGEIFFYGQAPDTDWTNDSIYGPSTIELLSSTDEIIGLKSTDIPNGEYLASDVVNGLVAVQYRSSKATMVAEPMNGVLGNMTVETDEVHIYTDDLAGRSSVEVIANVPLNRGLNISVSVLIEENFTGLPVDPYPYPGGSFSDYLYNSTNKVVTVVPEYTIQAKWVMFYYNGAQDADMGNFYDHDCNGVYTVDDEVDTGHVASGANNPEIFSVALPPAGCYWIHAAGYDVSPGSLYDLYFYVGTIGNGSFQYENYPTTTVTANTPVTFDIVWNFTSMANGTTVNESIVIDPGKAPFALTQYVAIYWHYKMMPAPPTDVTASLTGQGGKDVEVSWTLSIDDGGGKNNVDFYLIFRGETYASSRAGYAAWGATQEGITSYTDSNRGEGDPTDYFYAVCAYTADLLGSCAPGQSGKFTRPLAPGMRLISTPLNPSDESVTVVLQTVRFDAAWVYDGSWKSYMRIKPYGGSLSTVNSTLGVWVKVAEDCNFTVAGSVPSTTDIYLRAGWNLVGFPSLNSSFTVGDLAAQLGALVVDGLDPGSPPFYLRRLLDGETLVTGSGYWVLVDMDTVWTVVF